MLNNRTHQKNVLNNPQKTDIAGALAKIEAALEKGVELLSPFQGVGGMLGELALNQHEQALALCAAIRDTVDDWHKREKACKDYSVPYELFTTLTCKSMTGCGKCEKCVYMRKNPPPYAPEEDELFEILNKITKQQP